MERCTPPPLLLRLPQKSIVSTWHPHWWKFTTSAARRLNLQQRCHLGGMHAPTGNGGTRGIYTQAMADPSHKLSPYSSLLTHSLRSFSHPAAENSANRVRRNVSPLKKHRPHQRGPAALCLLQLRTGMRMTTKDQTDIVEFLAGNALIFLLVQAVRRPRLVSVGVSGRCPRMAILKKAGVPK